MIVKAAKCDGYECDKLLDIDGEDFYTISGNVYLGLTGGLIGNNLDENKTVIRDVHLCKSCFEKSVCILKFIS